MVHSVLCTVYTVMYVQFLVCFFHKHDWQSLNKSVNDIFDTKFFRIKCYVYCIQCNVGTVFLFDYPGYQSPNQS